MPGVIGGVYFLLFLSAIWMVITWCKANDKGPETKEITGLFAMKANVEKIGKSRRPPRFGERE
jgi:hypothetical protein